MVTILRAFGAQDDACRALFASKPVCAAQRMTNSLHSFELDHLEVNTKVGRNSSSFRSSG